MSTFDGWETRLYGDAMALPSSELMHFRTKGSKNGVRRYQTESGAWTPLGLKERKAREGWGESRRERKAAKKVAKAERKAAKAEKKATRTAERKQRMANFKEQRQKNDIGKLTDAELKKKLERVRMEQEYKEMTKSPLLKTGEKLFNSILDYKARSTEAKANLARAKLDNNRVMADIIRAKEATKTAKENKVSEKYKAKSAKANAVKQKWDTKGGLKTERKKDLLNAKTNYRGTTIRGAIGKHFNNMAKYRQELRMNPIEAKKHQRAKEMAEIALEKDRQKTKQEKWKTKGGRK